MIGRYQYKTLREFEGKQYVEVSEVEELLQKTFDAKAAVESLRDNILKVSTSLVDLKKETVSLQTLE